MDGNLKSAEKLKRYFLKLLAKKDASKTKLVKNSLSDIRDKLEGCEASLNALDLHVELSKFNEVKLTIHQKKLEIDTLYDDLDKPLNIYVVGENDLGKTTLIKAIIGLDDLQTSPQTEEAVVSVYRSNQHLKKAQVMTSDKVTIQLDTEGVLDYIEQHMLSNAEANKKIKKNYEALRGLYVDDEQILDDLKSTYHKTLEKASHPIEEVTWPVESDSLKNFTLSDTEELSEDALNSFYKADAILFLINEKKLYFKQEEYILDFIKNKKAIGIINRSDIIKEQNGDAALEELLKDSKDIFKTSLQEIVAVSSKEALIGKRHHDEELMTSSGMNELVKTINKHFIVDSENIKLNAKHQGLRSLMTELKRDLKTFSKELKSGDEKRNTLRSNFRDIMKKETSMVHVKVDWVLTNYEMVTKTNIELKCKDIFELGHDLSTLSAYVENDIFDVNGFINELVKLKDNTIKTFEKLREKNIKEYKFADFKHLPHKKINFTEADITAEQEVDTYSFLSELNINELDILNTLEVNVILDSNIGKSGLMMPFIKKKKIIAVQSKLMLILESIIDQIKTKLYSEIEQDVNHLYDEAYENIEVTFAEMYCEPNDVNRALRSIEELQKNIIIPEFKMSVRDMIFSKKRISH